MQTVLYVHYAQQHGQWIFNIIKIQDIIQTIENLSGQLT